MVFGVLNFAIDYTGGDFVAMYKRASGIFAHTVYFFHLLCANPFLDIVSRFVFGEETVYCQLFVVVESSVTDFRDVVFTAQPANGFLGHLICDCNLFRRVVAIGNCKRLFLYLLTGFAFALLGCICTVPMLTIYLIKLGAQYHSPASLFEPRYIVFVDIVTDVYLGKPIFLGDFRIGIIVGIQLVLLFFDSVYMGTGIIHLVVAVDSGDVVPQGKGDNGITAHTVFFHDLLRGVITVRIDFFGKVGKILVYEGAVVEHTATFFNLWDAV